MKYLFCLLLFSSFCVHAQMEVRSGFWGKTLTLNNQDITVGEAKEAAKLMPDALSQLNKAQTNRTIGLITGLAGSFVLGGELGKALNPNREANWGVAGAGLAGLIVGLVFDGAGTKNLRAASEAYNQKNNTTSFNPSLEIVSNNLGVGLALKF